MPSYNVGDLLFQRLLDKTWLFYIFRTLEIFPKFQTSLAICQRIWHSGDNVSDPHFSALTRWKLTLLCCFRKLEYSELGALFWVAIFRFGTFGIWHQCISRLFLCNVLWQQCRDILNLFQQLCKRLRWFLCLDFGVQLVQETPRSLSHQRLSIRKSFHLFNITGTSLLRCYLVNDRQPRLPWHFSAQ